MNWTGGSLQRTKKTGNGTLQKQKAYFARARTRLQHDPSSLPHGLPVNDLAVFRDSTANARPSPLTRQRTDHDVGLANDDLLSSRRYATRSHRGEQLAGPSLGEHCISMQRHDHDRKHHTADAGLETQLLEANKKRLLKSNDWAGISSLRPVNLQVESITNKEVFGKRRRVSKSRGRRVQHHRGEQLPEERSRQLHQERKSFMSGTIQSKHDGLRIRFGTDALTTNCSAQFNSRNPSPASSDSMLLDEDTLEAKEHGDFTAGIHRQLRSGTHRSRNDDSVGSSALSFERKVDFDHHTHDHLQSFVHPSDVKLASLDRQTDITVPIHGAIGQRSERRSESVTPAPPLTQHVGGERQPLRLVFDTMDTSADHSGEIEPLRADKGCTMHASTAVHAGASQLGSLQPARRREIDKQLPSEAAHSAAILIEEPWRTFLAISEENASQSLGCTKYEPLHARQSSSAEHRIDRSKRRMMETQRNLSTAQTSKCTGSPIVRDGSEVRFEDDGQHAGFRAQNKPQQVPENNFRDDEELWQNFVFGGLPTSSPQLLHGELFIEQTSSKGSSGYLPMSAAVSSIGASSRPASRAGSRIEHKTVKIVQASRSPTLSSPDAQSLENGTGMATASGASSSVRRAVGNGPGTHASLWNNASNDNNSISSRNLSNMSLSWTGPRDPEQTISSTFQRVHPSGSITWRPVEQLSMCDTFDSDDDKLDLIKAD